MKPNITVVDTFDTCIEAIRDTDKRTRLQGIRANVLAAQNKYDTIANAQQSHLAVEERQIAGANGIVTVSEMTNLYDRHMARGKSRGRDSYNKIMASAPYGQCPFCGHLPVSTLDHTLPKKGFPALAVTPLNLIPSCKDCNHNKGTVFSGRADEQFFNAYYDDVTEHRWLFAEIIEGSPAGIRYFTAPPAALDQVTEDRLNFHFRKLKLASIYASQGARQLQNIRRSLGRLFDSAGVDAVRYDLRERQASCAEISVNSWDGALYEAASNNNWYCSGGFRA